LFYRLNGAQFLQQGLVVDTVKAFLDVGVQNVFGLQSLSEKSWWLSTM
jgi:hypothetical protein